MCRSMKNWLLLRGVCLYKHQQCFRPMRIRIQLFSSMWIRIRDPRSQTNADPNPGQTLGALQNGGFWHEKYCMLYVGNMSYLFVNFGQFSLLLDPDSHSQYVSGSRSRRAKSMRNPDSHCYRHRLRVPIWCRQKASTQRKANFPNQKGR